MMRDDQAEIEVREWCESVGSIGSGHAITLCTICSHPDCLMAKALLAVLDIDDVYIGGSLGQGEITQVIHEALGLKP